MHVNTNNYFSVQAIANRVFWNVGFLFDYDTYKKNSREHYFSMYDEMHGTFYNNWKDFYRQVLKAPSIPLQNRLEEDQIKFATYLDERSCELLFNVLKLQG